MAFSPGAVVIWRGWYRPGVFFRVVVASFSLIGADGW
jgi:hypothetical protein